MSVDLRPFCRRGGDDGQRYRLSTPWLDTGWLYASDQRVAVRHPSVRAALSSDTDRRPLAATVFPKVFPICRAPWPTHSGDRTNPKCATCNGAGIADCECQRGHKHSVACHNCQPAAMQIGNRKIAGDYCLLIQALGDVRYCPVGGLEDLLYFISGEVQGCVAPLAADVEIRSLANVD